MSINTTKMAQIAINKSVCKEFATSNSERTVYLKDGDEFQICLFNPYQETVAADISIDNKSLGGRIILNPGERCWLERYLDVKSKFKFETYEIDGNDSDAVKAISQNGKVNVRFYKEKQYTPVYRSIDPIDCALNTLTNSTGDMLLTSKSVCSNGVLGLDTGLGSISAREFCMSNAVTPISANLETGNAVTANLETGRTSKGSYSSQNFQTVYKEFESWSFHSESLLILPESRKPYTVNDLQKIYCTECGRKLNSKYKYCPYCGTKCE